MIKFFRKIRQNLLSEGKTSKYLKYAVGEILLVVIGILIALQVNNWNESNKNKVKEYKYLSNINKEVITDSIVLEKSWFRNRRKKIECLLMARQYVNGDYIPNDTLQFINNVGFGGINSRVSLTSSGSSRTYTELVSTGNLSLISDDSLRNLIMRYYSFKEFLDRYTKSVRTDYADFVSSLKAFNPKYPDSINAVEIPRILKKMKTDEFHSIINMELTYSYSIEIQLERYMKGANVLHKKIEAYLQNK